MTDLEDIVHGAYAEVPEVIRELFARIPWEQTFTLSNGRTARIVKFFEPKKDNTGSWHFGLDVKLSGGHGPDHLEFIMTHTGGGGSPASFGVHIEVPE